MINLKRLIVENVAMQTVGESLFVRLLQGEYSEALEKYKSGLPLFRSVSGFKGHMLKFDPTLYERRSKDSSNFYTVGMSVFPEWKDYPKRNRCVIAATHEPAKGYGTNYYYVFPINGAKIGISPMPDLWDGFSYAGQITDVHSIDTLMNQFKKVLYYGGVDSSTVEKCVKTVTQSEFGSAIKTLNETFSMDTLKESLGDTPDIMRYGHINTVYGHINTAFLRSIYSYYKGDWEEYWRMLMDPQKNGFRVQSIKELSVNEHQEVWTDSECLMVAQPYMNEYIKRYLV